MLDNDSNKIASLDLRDQFLIAMPGLNDPDFDHAVIYICHQDDEGAMGLIVNQLTDSSLQELLSQVDIELNEELHQVEVADAHRVFYGGPVRPEQGFVLHSRDDNQFEDADNVSDTLALSGSLEVLKAIARGEGPKDFLVCLGYAGWGPGQLEAEIQNNSWLTAPAQASILFNSKVEQRWRDAVASLGFDPSLLQSTAGHA